MQLSRRARAPGVSIHLKEKKGKQLARLDADLSQVKPRGFIPTGVEIVKRETPLGLYKGLGAVLSGIVPKMAIRFTSYGWFKQALTDKEKNTISSSANMVGKSIPSVWANHRALVCIIC